MSTICCFFKYKKKKNCQQKLPIGGNGFSYLKFLTSDFSEFQIGGHFQNNCAVRVICGIIDV